MSKRLMSLFLCVALVVMSAAGRCEEDEWSEWLCDDSDALAMDAAESTPEDEQMMDEMSAGLEDTTTVSEEDGLEINEALPGDVVNILLLGIDNRSRELVSGRSDAIIICSINMRDGTVTLTSIARDTAVSVPGYQNRQRINTAFKFGSKDGDIAKGAELAMRTVNRNFGMNIRYYVVINIHGLADIIDAIGGLDIELTAAEASAINYELFVKEPMDSNAGRVRLSAADGVQHLDGMQSVTYGRIRNLKGQNDLDRNGRQRVLLETLLKTVLKDMNLTKLISLIEIALPYAYTNLSVDDLIGLCIPVLSGKAMENLASGQPVLQQFGIPVKKQYSYRKYGDNSLIYINKRRMKTTLGAMQELIYGRSFVE